MGDLKDPLALDKLLESVFQRVIPQRTAASQQQNPEHVFQERRDNTLFESFFYGADAPSTRLPLEWHFAEPTACPLMNFNLKKILNETDLSLLARIRFGEHQRNAQGLSAGEMMDTLSEALFRLRGHVFSPKNQSRNPALLYATLMRRLSNHFHNNTAPFVYELPRRAQLPAQRYQSDNFCFEYLHALLTLLARMHTRALTLPDTEQALRGSLGETCVSVAGDAESQTMALMTTNVWKQRARYYTFCIEVLQEIHEACRAARECYEKEGRQKFLFVASPENMSSAQPQLTDRQALAGDERNRSGELLLQFIENGLGGEGEIVARIYYLLAKRNEMAYRDMLSRPATNPEWWSSLPSLMQSIVTQYEEARQLTKRFSRASQFYKYTKFMCHLWRCRLHGFVALLDATSFLTSLNQQQNTAVDATLEVPIDPSDPFSLPCQVDEKLESAKQALVRVKHIVDADAQFLSKWPTLLTELDASARQAYDEVMQQSNELYARLDQEIYVKRRIVPTDDASMLPAIEQHKFKPGERILNDAGEYLLKEQRNHPLADALLLTESIGIQYHAEVTRSATATATTTTTIQEEVLVEQRQEEEMVDETPLDTKPVYDADDIRSSPLVSLANDCKLEILRERQRWIAWILSFYDEERETFTLGEAFYAQLLDEQEQVSKRLKMEKK